MLTFIARMKVKEGKEQEFIEIVTELTEKVMANEPDTKIYQFYRLRDEERGFAVIESFGGWGLTARFADLDGLTLRPPR